jgi:hypothetical protein
VPVEEVGVTVRVDEVAVLVAGVKPGRKVAVVVAVAGASVAVGGRVAVPGVVVTWGGVPVEAVEVAERRKRVRRVGRLEEGRFRGGGGGGGEGCDGGRRRRGDKRQRSRWVLEQVERKGG